MSDWSFLAPDLIRHVGDLLLATSDVDGYMDMRAVCRGWRSAVADPRSYSAADLRFCPRQWVMLDDDDKDDEGRLFVNVSTGRFFRRRLPVLRDHALVNASDGLLVLAESRDPYACRVLNPLTGHILRFAARIGSSVRESRTVTAAAGSDPIVLLADTGDVYSRPSAYIRRAWFADPASEDFYGHPTDSTHHVASTVAYGGKIYMAYTDGSVFRRVGSSAQHGHTEPIIAASKPSDQTESVFLVESAGELLLVLRQRRIFRVFRVDVERKALEPATSIGGRALFLGRRCLSVAADKFPTMEGDCLYYAMRSGWLSPKAQDMYQFKMKGGSESLVSSNIDQMSGTRRLSAHRPLSIAMVFLTYCLNLPDVRTQILKMRRARLTQT
jgi:hypothetical protein